MTPDTFTAPELGFEITKPKNWEFVPTQWAKNTRKHAKLTPAQSDILAKSAVPFVYLQYVHDSPDYAFPTIQVTCRLLTATPPLLAQLLALQTQTIARTYPDATITDATDAFVLSGHPATHFKSVFSIKNHAGTEFSILSRSYLVIVGQLAFTLGLSGPSKGPHTRAADFEAILKSVKISPCI